MAEIELLGKDLKLLLQILAPGMACDCKEIDFDLVDEDLPVNEVIGKTEKGRKDLWVIFHQGLTPEKLPTGRRRRTVGELMEEADTQEATYALIVEKVFAGRNRIGSCSILAYEL